MFKRNLLTQYQEYFSKNLNKDKVDTSVVNKLSLYSELKNEVRFETYLDLIMNVKNCYLLNMIPRAEILCPLCNRSMMNSTIC